MTGSWYGVSNVSASVHSVSFEPQVTCKTLSGITGERTRVGCEIPYAIGRFMQLVSRTNAPDFQEIDIIVKDIRELAKL